MNETHNPKLTSWVTSANGHADFPIQNLPYGIFRRARAEEPPRVGIAIGDQILDVTAVHALGGLTGTAAFAARACATPTLNALMTLGPEHWSALRSQVSTLVGSDSPLYRSDPHIGTRILVPRSEAELFLPAEI